MMFDYIKNRLLYVKITKDVFHIRDIQNDKNIMRTAQTPFSSKRLLIGEFSVAQKLLKEAFKELGIHFIAPKVIMHPLELVDTELSGVEDKVFREVALSAGAREVTVWMGRELNDTEALGVINGI